MRHAFVMLLLLAPMLSAAADIDVEVQGIDADLHANALAFLSIHQYRDKEDLTEAMIRRLHARAPEEIRRALTAFGYYRAEVDANLVFVDDTWQARYTVRRGPPVRLRAIDVRVNGDADAAKAFDDLLAESPLAHGQILRHAQYDALKNALLNRATQLGYLDASFTTQRLEVNTETLEARVELVLDAGPRYYFGDIEIRQDILDDDFVRRYVEFDRGDPLNYTQLLDLQYALTDSEYFAAVQVEALRDEASDDRLVPVRVSADANERTRYTAGLGYGTDTGARVTLGFQRRYVNRRGHRLAFETLQSEIEDSYTLRYTIPLAEPAREHFQLFAGTLRADRGDTESDRWVLGASRVRTLGDWEQTLYLRAEREDSHLPGDDFRTETLIPGASWMKTAADDLFYTRDGYKLYADIHGSHPSIGSRTEYLQLHLLGKRIIPLGENWRVLLRAEAAGTALGETSRLPVSQRFFAGGDYSVRGYDYNRLGPRDDEGNVIGGSYLVTGSAEIEYRFAPSWAVAAFTDAGNAMDDLDTDLRRSAGIGLRWISPVGVVRLDLAKPLDAINEPSRGIEIHISVGPDL